jgi:hypothetical protein
MGDCRMKIVVSKKISSQHVDETTIKQYPSDATIRDVRDDMLRSLSSGISVWDCTLHPAKNISSWLFEEFPEKMGPKSKTLFDAGCFPSAVWQILPEGDAPVTQSVMEDHQYNQNSSSGAALPSVAASKVELVDQPKGGLKPSEVLHQITQRFEGDDDDSDAARVVRQKQKKERRAKEMARHSKLEARIKTLGAIKSGTSEQLRKMLLKSRCTGAKSLKMPDRVYLQVAHVKGEADVTEDFRYFSRQDTVARLVQTLSDAKPPQEAELLVSSSSQTYRRLPLTLRLHEGIEKGWLKDADTVVVRYFTPPEQEATTSILVEEDNSGAEDAVMTEVVEPEEVEPQIAVPDEIEAVSPAAATTLPHELTARFTSAIATIDKKSKTKKSSSAQRVRQMMMKSKSKGDAKRVPKMENRFFVEVILVNANNSSTSCFVFMAKSDSLDRLLQEHIKADCVAYAIKSETGYIELSTGSTLQALDDANILHCFDRIVVDKS